MYGDQIARITRDHCLAHLEALLDAANGLLDKPVTLIMPRTFDISSYVGGRTGVAGRETLPSLSIDAPNKVFAGVTEDNLWEFNYTGQVLGMVAARSGDEAESIAKCYVGAIETYINSHQHAPFDDTFNESGLPFRIAEFGWTRSSRFGATNLADASAGARAGSTFWTDGFRTDVFWTVSESGPGQHG